MVDFSNAKDFVTLDLTQNHDGGDGSLYGFAFTNGSFLGGTYLTGIEDASGTAFNDIMTGDGNANTLLGNGDDDTLSGGGGNDTLIGGSGDDTLLPGYGVDVVDGGGSIGGLNDGINTLLCRRRECAWSGRHAVTCERGHGWLGH